MANKRRNSRISPHHHCTNETVKRRARTLQKLRESLWQTPKEKARKKDNEGRANNLNVQKDICPKYVHVSRTSPSTSATQEQPKSIQFEFSNQISRKLEIETSSCWPGVGSHPGFVNSLSNANSASQPMTERNQSGTGGPEPPTVFFSSPRFVTKKRT